MRSISWLVLDCSEAHAAVTVEVAGAHDIIGDVLLHSGAAGLYDSEVT